ncbi:patatin-domain-containing protein [Aulographum hederae CBS 113979]|uniref:Patatin-domain-containing protein n=1 Tax=Aulographum hederae CBS 113979 TaxID=1176131 RepID=A0A6G1GTA5_9PEZI|nr:patatin-domain-containing protein [Aulographum hederae CBS 113979]
MADENKATDGPAPVDDEAYDFTKLPDYDQDFIDYNDFAAFAEALTAPEPSPSTEDLTAPPTPKPRGLFITALNDWRPVRQRARRRKKRRAPPRRGKDETREGFVYTLLKWPLLVMVFGWLVFLGISYLLTRSYIFMYEHYVTWRGTRETLRKSLQAQTTYEDWVAAAKELDTYLRNDAWKKDSNYAYYNSKTLQRVTDRMTALRTQAELDEANPTNRTKSGPQPIDELHGLVEACVKNNFVGSENPRLYSETYYGTKDLVQDYFDEAEASLSLLARTHQLSTESKRVLFKHIHTNYGRTALCLSGGATFAYYHFGVAKALLDANLLPDVITGTSGGALVAALLATRSNDELKKLLVPALAHRITACHDSVGVWAKRWYRTGARFDSIDWAQRCAWFTYGSMTFREAYARTGRILNVTCVPSDPHSPNILLNYLTSPDCVIWSAVLASAAVPGILNPVVLMKKTKLTGKDGSIEDKLEPYSFGHKWKDGSLRTDIPLKALNLHFNVNFSIVSQVNPHINLFFFSSRGSVGRPVTHRRGRGWRGGFLGSATEQYLKLDLTKWLKVLRHLELLPRPLGQDWSEIWLQRFSGTITIWPKSIISDYFYILSDPTPQRLARMIRYGQLSAWPKLKFIGNRMKVERLIEQGRRATRTGRTADGGLHNILSDEDLRGALREARQKDGLLTSDQVEISDSDSDSEPFSEGLAGKKGPFKLELPKPRHKKHGESNSISQRLTGWWSSISSPTVLSPKSGNTLQSRPSASSHPPPYSISTERPTSMFELRPPPAKATSEPNAAGKQKRFAELFAQRQGGQSMREALAGQPHADSRRGSLISEFSRQSRVFFDDDDFDRSSGDDAEESREEKVDGNESDVESLEDEALDDEGSWEADENKEKLGMMEEREREEEAVQKTFNSSGGTTVG